MVTGIDCKGHEWEKREKLHPNAKNITGFQNKKLTAMFPVIVKNKIVAMRTVQWLCQCSCGNQIVVDGKDLRDRKIGSCGCLHKDAGEKRSNEIFLGKRFGLLTVKEKVGYQNRATVWRCQCDCGNEKDILGLTLTRGATVSCGCLRQSYGEMHITQLLEEAKIPFQAEFSFPDLVSESNRRLRYDFAIFDEQDNVIRLIEFDGKQHIQVNDLFGGATEFKKLQLHDKLKNEYALEHCIPLTRIPYTEKMNLTLDLLFSKKYEIISANND